MKKAIVGALLVGAVVVTASFVMGWVPGDAEPVEEGEVTIDQVPAAVKATILKEAGDNTIEEIEAENENGALVYEAEWKVDGMEVEIKVAPDGTIVGREAEVTLEDVPAPVKATILKEAAGNTIEEVEIETEGDKTTYEAEWHEGDTEIEIKVAPDGTLLEREVEEEDDDDDDVDHQDGDDDDDEDEREVTIDQVPAAVKATILAEAAGNTIEEIEEENENGALVYEAEWHEGNKEIEIKVAPDGKLLEKEVEDEDDDDDDDDD